MSTSTKTTTSTTADTGTSSYFDLDSFEKLLGKLEASKIKQLGEKAKEDRRQAFATGLAQMMSNF